MSWIEDLMEAPARAMCTFTGGHDLRWRGGILVCDYCGKVVK